MHSHTNSLMAPVHTGEWGFSGCHCPTPNPGTLSLFLGRQLNVVMSTLDLGHRKYSPFFFSLMGRGNHPLFAALVLCTFISLDFLQPLMNHIKLDKKDRPNSKLDSRICLLNDLGSVILILMVLTISTPMCNILPHISNIS